MRPVRYDSSVYISALRLGQSAVLQTRNLLPSSPLWLSAVVLEELYAGADPAGRKLLAKLERDFEQIGRMLIPALGDWSQTGNVLAKIGAKYGSDKIGKARKTNDTLIGTSAARQGVTVLTKNARLSVDCRIHDVAMGTGIAAKTERSDQGSKPDINDTVRALIRVDEISHRTRQISMILVSPPKILPHVLQK